MVSNWIRAVKSWFIKIGKKFSSLSKAKKVIIIAIAILLITGSGVSAWYINRLSNIENLFSDFPNNEEQGDNFDIHGSFQGKKIINIAFLGFDNNEARSKTRLTGYTGLVDTIMVAALNIETGQLDIVSIPRDAYVTIYNQNGYKDKINSANYWGWQKGLPDVEDKVEAGIITQLETISMVLGVPIHYYVGLDIDAGIEIVDIMGGVWYDVPELTRHNHGRIIAEPGYQWFDGKRFLDYVRSRVSIGDYGRAQKQQDVMIEVFKQFKQANKLVKAPQVYLVVRDNVRTNLSLEQIMALALFGNKKVDAANISTHLLEGSLEWGAIPGRPQGNNYYIIDQAKRVELVQEVWGVSVPQEAKDVLLPAAVASEEEEEDEGPGLNPSAPDLNDSPSFEP